MGSHSYNNKLNLQEACKIALLLTLHWTLITNVAYVLGTCGPDSYLRKESDSIDNLVEHSLQLWALGHDNMTQSCVMNFVKV